MWHYKMVAMVISPSKVLPPGECLWARIKGKGPVYMLMELHLTAKEDSTQLTYPGGMEG